MIARPAPQVDVLALQATVESLRADIDMILEARVPESEAPFAVPAEDRVMAVLFATFENQPPLPHGMLSRGRWLKLKSSE